MNGFRYNPTRHSRRAFTLIELVVVVLILGIIAAIAAPKMFDTASAARENSLRQNLAVVRDSIELHRSQVGSYPGGGGSEADFKSDLEPYLRLFPGNPLRNGSSSVGVSSSGNPPLFDGGPNAWLYDNQTGQFIANSNGTSSSGDTYDEL